MISFIRGTLVEIEENRIVIDTGSIGYEIFVPMTVIDRMPQRGSDIEVFTYLNVREDEMSLFGFLSRDELKMFKQLILVSGIGPKGALAVLSSLSPTELRYAILAGDVKTISSAPGIGKKTAERLIIELKDKVSVADALGEGQTYVTAKTVDLNDTVRSDAVEALTMLGYSSATALKAVSQIDESVKDTEMILKEALRILGGNA